MCTVTCLVMQTCGDVAVGILLFLLLRFSTKDCDVGEQCLFGVDLSIVDVCTV